MIIIEFESNKYILPFNVKQLANKITKETLKIEKYKKNVSISLSLVSKYMIRKINKLNRNIDKITDVLSFPNGDFDYNYKTLFLGDVVICYDKILSQARMYGHSIKREFSFLYVHSLLHLLGYDHMNQIDEKIMFDKQKSILEKLKINR